MDEKRLAELLKDAVADTPPPTFTQADVTRESFRQRARRRNGLLAGSAFGVAVLAGATALSVALWTGQGSPSEVTSAESAASAGNGNAAPYELPDEDARAADPTQRGGEAQDSSPESPKQGGTSDEDGGPAGSTGTPSGCEQADRELAAALAGELPAAAQVDPSDAVAVTLGCSTGARGAAFDLPDGRISILLVSSEQLAYTGTDEAASAGGAQASAPTSDGRLVLVVSEPASQGSRPPYESALSRYATDIAGNY